MDNSKMDKERWAQAVKAASCAASYRREHGFTETRDDYFVDGVQWADENPRKGLVDIEKAAEWLDETLRNTDFYDDEREEFVKAFKKAMGNEG